MLTEESRSDLFFLFLLKIPSAVAGILARVLPTKVNVLNNGGHVVAFCLHQTIFLRIMFLRRESFAANVCSVTLLLVTTTTAYNVAVTIIIIAQFTIGEKITLRGGSVPFCRRLPPDL